MGSAIHNNGCTLLLQLFSEHIYSSQPLHACQCKTMMKTCMMTSNSAFGRVAFAAIPIS